MVCPLLALAGLCLLLSRPLFLVQCCLGREGRGGQSFPGHKLAPRVAMEQPSTHPSSCGAGLGCCPHSSQAHSPVELSFGNGVRMEPLLGSLSDVL